MTTEQFAALERTWASAAALSGPDPRTLDTPENDEAEGASFLAFSEMVSA